MKKLFGLVLLCVAGMFVFSACSKEKSAYNNYPPIVGTWYDISTTEGEYVSSSLELSWTFNNNNTAIERVVMKVNDITLRDEALNFTYTYDGKTILLFGEQATLEYTVEITGNTMRLGNEETGYFTLTKK